MYYEFRCLEVSFWQGNSTFFWFVSFLIYFPSVRTYRQCRSLKLRWPTYNLLISLTTELRDWIYLIAITDSISLSLIMAIRPWFSKLCDWLFLKSVTRVFSCVIYINNFQSFFSVSTQFTYKPNRHRGLAMAYWLCTVQEIRGFMCVYRWEAETEKENNYTKRTKIASSQEQHFDC